MIDRRVFFLGLGAAACAEVARSKTTSSIAQPAPRADYDPVLRRTQVHASKVAIQGDLIIQSTQDALLKWNAQTMKRDGGWERKHAQFCLLADGTVVAVAFETHAEIYRITSRGLEELAGPVVVDGDSTVVLPGPKADEVYVATGRKILKLGLRESTAVELARTTHPCPDQSNRDQMFARADGRICAISDRGGLAVITPGTATTEVPTPKRSPVHLVAATGEQCWYSYPTSYVDWKVDRLALARVDIPMKPTQDLSFAPWRIVHLASFKDRAAVLLAHTSEARWQLALVDERGRELWRTTPAGDRELTAAFVALSETRVVLSRPDNTLSGWDAASGKPI